MNKRRDFASALALVLLGAPALARAQTRQRLPMVGFLDASPTARGGSSAGITAMVILGSPECDRARSTQRITAFAASNRLPAISPFRMHPDVGGLMSFGLKSKQFAPRAGVSIGKILNGAKPGELAIELPSKFEFVINLNAARALGIAMPQALLLRADEVIQ